MLALDRLYLEILVSKKVASGLSSIDFFTLKLKNKLSSSVKEKKNNKKTIKKFGCIGDYESAVKIAEYNYDKFKDFESTCILDVVKLMSNLDYEENLIKDYEFDNYEEVNIIKLIDSINEVISVQDKINYICSYVKSQGAIPVFINIKNKGLQLKNKSNNENLLIENYDLFVKERADWLKSGNIPAYLNEIYSLEEISELNNLFNASTPYIKSTKTSQSDCSTSFVSVLGGFRSTIEQPSIYNRSCYVFGSSTAFSIGVSDEDTIPSNIQKLINNDKLDIRVENCGVIGMNIISAINNMTQTNIVPGDIVLFFDFDELEGNSISYNIDLNDLDRGDCFFIDLTKNRCHFSKYGNKSISQEIYKLMSSDSFMSKSSAAMSEKNKEVGTVLDNVRYIYYKEISKALENCEMKSYLSLLESHVPDAGFKVGSVAVNCNPITKGHLHLLEHASRSVDKLFIFVIEEDKSFFKFEDRLHLVAESTKHLENVTVLRGGKFICTELTYPDYFDKDTTEAKADASMEAWFFCEYIAKTLNITKIFLGDEPKCMITKQYNEKMQELLPEYGIEVDIIDRIATNGDVISASKVRKLLEVGDFDGISQIVPEPTLQFLQENYGKSAA